jgi:ppGpp synthetase/RelA/SpoT-type nucleotidyltranferase
MTESQFLDRWSEEKSSYDAWGSFVVDAIVKDLSSLDIDLTSFLKTTVTPRLKTDDSLLDKAFYRAGKGYSNPYLQIEDKVGARFIVLLLDDIKILCDVIQHNPNWTFDGCKHFDEDKKNDPLLFTYQSVHYILRPTGDINHNGVEIPANTPCEVQLRTLLQHAHAELTHDAIYKSKRTVRPEVHRTVAKSMALIETTDDFFREVTEKLNHGPLEDYGVANRLDGLYFSLCGIRPHSRKSSLAIWDEFEQFIDDKLVDNIQSFIDDNNFLSKIIVTRFKENAFYQQSIVLFLYWMLAEKKSRLLEDWPLPKSLLEPLASDIGESLSPH